MIKVGWASPLKIMPSLSGIIEALSKNLIEPEDNASSHRNLLNDNAVIIWTLWGKSGDVVILFSWVSKNLWSRRDMLMVIDCKIKIVGICSECAYDDKFDRSIIDGMSIFYANTKHAVNGATDATQRKEEQFGRS